MNKTKYYCECCDYDAKIKGNYDKHLKTKKHLESTFSQHRVNKKSTISQQKVNILFFDCKYCAKQFTTKQSMYRHIKYTCKQNDDEDMKELVKLMNEKIDEQNHKIELMKSDMVKQEKIQDRLRIELQKRDRKITKLSEKLQINNNCHIVNNQYNNIQLLNYTDTDISHLTTSDFIGSLKKQNNCVKSLTEKIHYNPQKPENMNIYISNLKNKYVMVYENEKWQLKDCFENIYEHKEILLEEWINREKDNYPELRDKFEKYLDNKENNSIYNSIKEDIKLMMYNNRLNVLKNTITN